LENWFQSKIDNPYATKKDLFELQRMTQLDFKTIKRWLDNRRNRTKDKRCSVINKSKFSFDEKNYLMTFFIKTNGYPVQEDFRLMTQTLQRTNTQIKTWFNAQRFKLKTKNISNINKK
jgi:hypothetical protein